jgi:5-methylcytosine-specific restriction endonuclease McrA
MPQRTCDVCSSDFIPRRVDSTFCSKRCAKWYQNHVGNRGTCSLDDCERPLRAKGYCAFHYRQLVNPPAKVEVVCPACGEVSLKRDTSRRYCSLLCRDYDKWGPRSQPWPRHVRQPKAEPVAPAWKSEQRSCAWCDATFIPTQPHAIHCTTSCARRAGKARRRGREHGASGTYTWAEVTAKWIAIGKTCAYCQQSKRNDEIEPDHVIPLSRGGSNSIVNVVPSCSLCNADKRHLSLDEWYADRERRGLQPYRMTPRLSPAGQQAA